MWVSHSRYTVYLENGALTQVIKYVCGCVQMTSRDLVDCVADIVDDCTHHCLRVLQPCQTNAFCLCISMGLWSVSRKRCIR